MNKDHLPDFQLSIKTSGILVLERERVGGDHATNRPACHRIIGQLSTKVVADCHCSRRSNVDGPRSNLEGCARASSE